MCNRLGRLLLPVLLTTSICAPKLLFGQSNFRDPQEASNLTYHRTVSEVRLVFFPTDEHNRPVEALQKDDFAVVDNERVIRDFRSFTRADLTKLDVVVLMDTSESVQPQFQQEIAEVQQLISQSPWISGDTVSVLSFSGLEVHSVCVGNCGNWSIADRLASLPTGGATPLWDAVEVATDFLIQRGRPDVWRVIILFSDGDDTISKASFREVSEKILASEEQIYAIDVSSASDRSALLQRLADDSGGRCVRISEGAGRVFNDVIDDLHLARVVTYVPQRSRSDFHAIRILPTHNLKLQFRCRRGYYCRRASSVQTSGGAMKRAFSLIFCLALCRVRWQRKLGFIIDNLS